MIRAFFIYWMHVFIKLFPGNHLAKFRAILWNSIGFQVSLRANVMPSATLMCGNIFIGSDTFIGHEVLIIAVDVKIGQRCDIAPRCILHAGSHEIADSSRRAGKILGGEIEIGDGSWIGANLTVLSGVKLSHGTVVAAGSLILPGTYPPNVLLAGVPAKVKKYYEGQ
jgi:acetyltransferase-like isoleucine patch superfamily enzyme